VSAEIRYLYCYLLFETESHVESSFRDLCPSQIQHLSCVAMCRIKLLDCSDVYYSYLSLPNSTFVLFDRQKKPLFLKRRHCQERTLSVESSSFAVRLLRDLCLSKCSFYLYCHCLRLRLRRTQLLGPLSQASLIDCSRGTGSMSIQHLRCITGRDTSISVECSLFPGRPLLQRDNISVKFSGTSSRCCSTHYRRLCARHIFTLL
jgi:hypothetical protein